MSKTMVNNPEDANPVGRNLFRVREITFEQGLAFALMLFF